MQAAVMVPSLLVAVLCLSMVDGRPSMDSTTAHSRKTRSPGKCQPKPDSVLLEQRALCPFTKTSSKVFHDLDIEVEKAELDPECAKSGRWCGEGGSGVCTPVMIEVTYKTRNAKVQLAFVCAYEKEAWKGHNVSSLDGN